MNHIMIQVGHMYICIYQTIYLILCWNADVEESHDLGKESHLFCLSLNWELRQKNIYFIQPNGAVKKESKQSSF